jgi:PAS domain S-box-containing protein
MTKTQLINELEARGVWLERLGAIVDGSRDAVFISDEEAQFMLVNSAACDLTGYPEEELLEMRFPDLYAAEDLPAYHSTHHSIMDGHDALTEARILRKDGTRVATEFSNRRIEIAGTPYLHAIARDITERKKTEAALRLLSAITNQVSDAVLATDLEFKIIFLNKAFEGLFGFSNEDALGRTPAFLNVDPNADWIQREIYGCVSAGKEWRGEVLNRKKDGSTFPCELSAIPLLDDEGRIFAYAGTQRDITDRKASEEEREVMISQLRDALQQLEALTGIVPICSRCTRPRDDRDFWKQIEVLVRERSKADFGGGLCAECAREVQP